VPPLSPIIVTPLAAPGDLAPATPVVPPPPPPVATPPAPVAVAVPP
jgi:hypothetical protein